MSSCVSSLRLQANLDRQVRDLQSQLDEATGSAARAAKKEAASLRQRVSGSDRARTHTAHICSSYWDMCLHPPCPCSLLMRVGGSGEGERAGVFLLCGLQFITGAHCCAPLVSHLAVGD